MRFMLESPSKSARPKGGSARSGQNHGRVQGGGPRWAEPSRRRMGRTPPAASRFCAKGSEEAGPAAAGATRSGTASVCSVRYCFCTGSKTSMAKDGISTAPVRSGTRSCSTVRVPVTWPFSMLSLSVTVASYARSPAMAASFGSRRSRTFPRPFATSRKVTGCPTARLCGSTVAVRFHCPTLPGSNPGGFPGGRGCTSSVTAWEVRRELPREKSMPNPVSTSTSAGSMFTFPGRSAKSARLRRR